LKLPRAIEKVRYDVNIVLDDEVVEEEWLAFPGQAAGLVAALWHRGVEKKVTGSAREFIPPHRIRCVLLTVVEGGEGAP